MPLKSQSEICEEITSEIIAAIEAGADNYRMPWNQSSDRAFPFNIQSKKNYRGINTIILLIKAHKRNYPTHVWGTYNQWQDIGAQVQKGEKSTAVVFWKPIVKKNRDTGEDEKFFVMREYHVFNAAQVSGFAGLPAPKQVDAKSRIAELDHVLIDCSGVCIQHGGNRAYYSPSLDTVQMPNFDQFRTVSGYYSVLAHELTHWTGHKSRLNRDFKSRFGSEDYAFEELIAELGAAFTMANLNFATEPRTDHAPYIQSWLKVLKNDKKAIFTAASAAQKATDYLLGEHEETEETENVLTAVA